MSDNGLRQDRELFLEVLDTFGLGPNCLVPSDKFEYKYNKRVKSKELI